jgi:serine/threonine-protein kinase
MTDLPQRIGPYRVLDRLGRGGMGEVFLAYDDRLDRRVAIKRIRPDAGISDHRRERFRREARLSARLNHPAIVQIYDIVTEGDLEYIVMEAVEGANLHTVMERGPLGVPQVLGLARQLAEGLDAAHRQGIVHRDFKAENVLMTGSGQAKITDFGIAKQLLADSEDSLTKGNAVLGTYRTMSPEQARGEEVDHRTDLFAFGVLLYEALTGRSPFEAENALATLNRVIHFRQEPVRSLNPAVPEDLSALVDDLLEKDPDLRPQSAGQVRRRLEAMTTPMGSFGETETIAEPIRPASRTAKTAGPTLPLPSGLPRRGSTLAALRVRPLLALSLLAVLLALLGTGVYFALRRPREPVYVAVLPPKVGTGSTSGELDLLASAVRVALVRQLSGLEGVSVLEADDSTSGAPIQAAKALGVDELVRSQLDCQLEACNVSLSRVRGSDGSVVWASQSFAVPTDDFALVASAVANQIRQGYSELPARRGMGQAVSHQDFQTYLDLRRQLGSGTDLGALLAKLEALRGHAPGFVDAYLLEADVARRRFYLSRDSKDLDRAFQRVEEARDIAPDDPRTLLNLVSVALAGGRLGRAEAALDELQRLTPGDVQVSDKRAQLLSAKGQTEEGVKVLAAAAARHPSARRLYSLATMEYQLGRSADSRRHVDESLQRSPGYRNSLSLLAQIELVYGDVQRAVDLYSDLLRQAAGPVEQTNLGLAYFTLGRYPEAAQAFRRVLAQEPGNPVYGLNLADTLLLQGKKSEAEDLYRRVIELTAADPSGQTEVQLLTVRAQALAHLGRGQEAVTSVQEALRLAPNNSQTVYEASLVYCLLGEESSALVNATKALKLGCPPRWFTFPWFAPLRAHPEFRPMLQDAPAAPK